MNNKEKYRSLCVSEHRIPIFLKAWWLDTTAGENNWDVAIVEKDNKIVACLPYVIKKAAFFRAIGMPFLTPFLGIWIDYPENLKYTNKLSYEKQIFNELISQLPKFDKFFITFDHWFNNWLPFYWKNFEQTTHYTYVIENLKDLDAIFSNFRENIRREIRKAQKHLTVHNDGDIETLHKLHKIAFKHKNKRIFVSLDYLRKIDDSCLKNDCRKIFFAKDKDGNLHAALYLVWDTKSCYYLIGCTEPMFRNSGAMSLLMWEAIQFSAKVTTSFNFRGSMLESIERFFRAFGAMQKPYFIITKTNSRMIMMVQFLKKILQ